MGARQGALMGEDTFEGVSLLGRFGSNNTSPPLLRTSGSLLGRANWGIRSHRCLWHRRRCALANPFGTTKDAEYSLCTRCGSFGFRLLDEETEIDLYILPTGVTFKCFRSIAIGFAEFGTCTHGTFAKSIVSREFGYSVRSVMQVGDSTRIDMSKSHVP